MIRSNFAITRLILLPYVALLALYLLVVGGGGVWLYYEVRSVETQLLMDEVLAVLEPLAEKLGALDAVTSTERNEPWLIADIQTVFDNLPSLRNVFVRGRDRGFEMYSDAGGAIASRAISSLPAVARRASSYSPAATRLHSNSDALFLIRFDLSPETAPLVRNVGWGELANPNNVATGWRKRWGLFLTPTYMFRWFLNCI